MRKTEKNVRNVVKAYDVQYKLLSVKPYVVLYHADPAAVYQIRHLCKPARWAMVNPWKRAEYSGAVKDGKCDNCKRKLKTTKYELVAKMVEFKDALQGSVSLVARTGDFQSSGGSSILPRTTI